MSAVAASRLSLIVHEVTRFRDTQRYRETGRKIATLGPPEAYRKNIRISAGTLPNPCRTIKRRQGGGGEGAGGRTVVRPEIRATELARGAKIRALEVGVGV